MLREAGRVAQPGWHRGTVCQAGMPEPCSWNGYQTLQGVPGVSVGLCSGSWQGGWKDVHPPAPWGFPAGATGISWSCRRPKGRVPWLLPLPGMEPLVAGRSPWLWQPPGRDGGA